MLTAGKMYFTFRVHQSNFKGLYLSFQMAWLTFVLLCVSTSSTHPIRLGLEPGKLVGYSDSGVKLVEYHIKDLIAANKYSVLYSASLNGHINENFVIKFMLDLSNREYDPLESDPLLKEYLLMEITGDSRITPSVLGITDQLSNPLSWKSPKLMFTDRMMCLGRNVRYRGYVMEKVGPVVGTVLQEFLRYDKGRFLKSAVHVGIKAISLLKKLHRLGIVHGDFHSENVAFVKLGSDYSEFAASRDDLILIDLGMAERIGAATNSPKPLSINRVLLSPWQLEDELASPRDDLFRVLEMIAELLGSQYFSQFERLAMDCITSGTSDERLTATNQLSDLKRNAFKHLNLRPWIRFADEIRTTFGAAMGSVLELGAGNLPDSAYENLITTLSEIDRIIDSHPVSPVSSFKRHAASSPAELFPYGTVATLRDSIKTDSTVAGNKENNDPNSQGSSPRKRRKTQSPNGPVVTGPSDFLGRVSHGSPLRGPPALLSGSGTSVGLHPSTPIRSTRSRTEGQEEIYSPSLHSPAVAAESSCTY